MIATTMAIIIIVIIIIIRPEVTLCSLQEVELKELIIQY